MFPEFKSLHTAVPSVLFAIPSIGMMNLDCIDSIDFSLLFEPLA